MDKIHVRFSVSQPCLTDAVIVILNGLLSYEHPSNPGGCFLFFRRELWKVTAFRRCRQPSAYRSRR